MGGAIALFGRPAAHTPPPSAPRHGLFAQGATARQTPTSEPPERHQGAQPQDPGPGRADPSPAVPRGTPGRSRGRACERGPTASGRDPGSYCPGTVPKAGPWVRVGRGPVTQASARGSTWNRICGVGSPTAQERDPGCYCPGTVPKAGPWVRVGRGPATQASARGPSWNRIRGVGSPTAQERDPGRSHPGTRSARVRSAWPRRASGSRAPAAPRQSPRARPSCPGTGPAGSSQE
jgi:hypothetical protein